jgi:lipoate-protein ligase A
MAVEEYLLKEFKDDCFMLWQNEPAIIVGKHQNTLAEINHDYVKENQIRVVRRLSGGGAVFHDLGNLNFTFIMNGEDGKLVDFRKFTQPILDVLLTLDINARFEGRNDLTIEGKKFSGNAEHVYKKRVLHHGTLLFSSLMTDLGKALKVNPLKYRDKAVKSVRSRVTNINAHLKKEMDVLQFRDMIMEHITSMYADSMPYEFTPEDIAEIQKLRDEKYVSWDWNFGYSPKYNFEKMIKTEGGNIEFHIDVDRGIMHDVKIYGDFFNMLDIQVVVDALKGVPHEEKSIREKLKPFDIGSYFSHVSIDEFISGMF